MSENKARSVANEISDYISIYSQSKKASDTNNYTKIEELMLCEKYSYIPKETKEATILRAALEPIQLQKLKGPPKQSEWNFLYYLIFEHKIGEDVYSKMDCDYKSPIIEDMFAKRRLNAELATELSNSDTPIKRPKV